MLALVALVPTLVTPPLTAQADWPEFRGPNGLAVAGDAPIPLDFGPEKGVLWRTAVPGGHSSPCIAGGRIFLTGFEEGRDVLLAVDRASGEVLWTRAFEGPPHPEYMHPDAGPALPTAVTDGEIVVAYFANYGLVAVSLDGEPRWEKRMPHPGHGFGVGTSPVMFEGLLVLSRDGGPEASVLVIDPADGSELHRIARPGFGEAHATPFVWRNPDRLELVIAGSGRLAAYDPGTGERLWSLGGLTSFPCTTPAADDDTLYFAAWSTSNASGGTFWEETFPTVDFTAEELADPALVFARLDADKDGKIVVDEVPEGRGKGGFAMLDVDGSGAWELAELTAVEAPGRSSGENLMVAVARGAEGDLTKADARWTWNKGLPYVCSPLLYRGRVWLVKTGGLVTALDAATGTPVFERERLTDRGEYYMSPVGAAGHVLVGSAEGTLYVLDAAAPELAVRHSVELGEKLFATPAVLDGTLFVRTERTLWAFGEPR